MTVKVLSSAKAADVVTVLCDAFHDYPVMRYVLGSATGYDHRLRTLIDFFVSARVLRNEPMLGIHDQGGAMVAAALVTPPGERAAPDALAARREAVWGELGAAERARYEAFGSATQRFVVAAPHYHLNMIGVRRAHAGLGFGRKLLDAVHALSHADPISPGVSLTTESPPNVALYEHCGYRVLSHARVADDLETWTLFRNDIHPTAEDSHAG